jgi:hypothetical protein
MPGLENAGCVGDKGVVFAMNIDFGFVLAKSHVSSEQ